MRRPPLVLSQSNPLKVGYNEVGWIVAAAGYEPRCMTYVRQLAESWGCSLEDVGRKLLLLEFDSREEDPTRRLADEFFGRVRPARRMKVSKHSGDAVREAVTKLAALQPGAVVVDYSAMSRLLYLSLVTLAYDGIDLLFTYSIGKYGAAELDYPIAAVGTIAAVPGFEGLHYHSRPHLHIVGLGYDGRGTLALVDKLEASRLVVFWAEPGASSQAAEIAKTQNAQLLERALARFSRDLRDIPGTVSVLSRLAFEVSASDKVVFVPVGPKPQILACALAAAPYEHCSVLAPYLGAGGMRSKVPCVEASGELVGVYVRSERRTTAGRRS